MFSRRPIRQVVVGGNWTTFGPSDVRLANARLIAAAPDMLATLRMLRPYLSPGNLKVVDHVIAKAKGRP